MQPTQRDLRTHPHAGRATPADPVRRLGSVLAAALTLGAAVPVARAQTASDPTQVSYSRDVRPILADHCFECHGPDANTREAELRLDRRAIALADRGDYAVIVPGQPERSELLRRVRDDSDPMPPDGHDRLEAEQIATLQRWIDQGADYDLHWAYEPPRDVAVPAVRDRDWPRNDLDRFVLAGLENADLEPAPAADPRTLVRRLAYDLLGLAPSPAAVEAFAADPSDAAWDRLVDDLLGSRRHAERLGTFWFDLVRFADTTGIHADNPWNIWPYRDWVLEAFHDNMPFDQFTVAQIAGDLLPEASLEQQVAAAYNRLNLITQEGGSQPKEFLIRYTADRVRNVSEVWMAASMGCCECHDHKFDPLSTREFYELGAFFADIEQVGVYNPSARNNFKPELPVPSASQTAEAARLQGQIAKVYAELAADTPALRRDLRRFERELLEQTWTIPAPRASRTTAGKRFEILDDGSLALDGAAADKDTYEIELPIPATGVAAVRLEALGAPGAEAPQPGRASNGNVVLSEFELLLGDRKLQVAASRASYEQPKHEIGRAHDGKGGRGGWALMRDGKGTPAEAVFDLAEPLGAGREGTLRVRLVQDYGSQHVLGRFRLSLAPRVGIPAVGPELRAALAGTPAATRPPELQARLRELHRAATPLLAEARARKQRLEAELAALYSAIPVVMQTRSVEPMESRVRPRGNWMDDSGDVVSPGVPAAFGLPLQVGEGERADRLDLARWLVDPRHPTTARVMVNRLWRMVFGAGLVASLDDFGVQGEEPTDRALLDHLARRFVDSGWDIRALLREMVTSRAYRQASWGEPVDPQRAAREALFGCQRRFRLDAEFVRDQALQVSGLLEHRFGGASVRPYQPAGYWQHLNFPKRRYQPSDGQDLFRRTVYSHWQRQYLHPSLLAFDAPSRERCVAERARSNTPLAALAGLNDPIFVEAARALAGRVLGEAGPDDSARLRRLFALTLQRAPSDREAALLSDLLAEHRAHYREAPDAAAALVKVGASPHDDQLSAIEHAAWTSLARVLLNLHETIQRS